MLCVSVTTISRSTHDQGGRLGIGRVRPLVKLRGALHVDNDAPEMVVDNAYLGTIAAGQVVRVADLSNGDDVPTVVGHYGAFSAPGYEV